MSSDLLQIGKSGAIASRIALDVTAQNITNASTDGYVRRSVPDGRGLRHRGAGRIGRRLGLWRAGSIRSCAMPICSASPRRGAPAPTSRARTPR
jgi:hypothetical protein